MAGLSGLPVDLTIAKLLLSFFYIGYIGKSNELVPCHDRYIPYDEDTRELLLLFPDSALGMRVFSLPRFGPYE